MTKQTDTPPVPTESESSGLIEASPTPLWVAEPNGDRRYFNPAWYSLTGRSADTELGWGWLDGVHADDKERVERTIRSAVRSGRRFGTCYRLACLHGEWRELEEHGYPHLHEGQVASWLGTCRDTTQAGRERERYREFAHLTNQVASAESSLAALNAILVAFDSSERKGAVFVLDSDGNPHLKAAPSIHELSIDASSEHIHQAVQTRQPVIARNFEIESEPWGFALPNNEAPLLALWALPAHAPLPGVFAVFHTTSALPSDDQVEDLSPWTSLISLALRLKE